MHELMRSRLLLRRHTRMARGGDAGPRSPASQAAIEQRHTRLNPGFKPTAADALLQNIADKKRRLADLGSSLSSGLFTSSSSDAIESPTKMRRETSNVLGEVASRVKTE